MSFSNTFRNIVVSPELVEGLFLNLLGGFGEASPDGNIEYVTIGNSWDDTAKTRKRAYWYYGGPPGEEDAGTIRARMLTDGRACFRALWQSDLESEFLAGNIPDVAELTDEQVAALLPSIPEIP